MREIETERTLKMDQFAVNPVAGDRPSPLRFCRFAAARWAGVAASSLAAFVSFVPLALAQERPSAAPLPVQIERSPASPESSNPQGLPTLEPGAAVPAPASDAPQDSIGQIDTQRPEMPFSDVPPDHWAYEALLYLSTGERSPRAVPFSN